MLDTKERREETARRVEFLLNCIRVEVEKAQYLNALSWSSELTGLLIKSLSKELKNQ